MTNVLSLAEALSAVARNGSDSEVRLALELCYAFMERVEKERLCEGDVDSAVPEILSSTAPRFLN